jgi:hypothetical protein
MPKSVSNRLKSQNKGQENLISFHILVGAFILELDGILLLHYLSRILWGAHFVRAFILIKQGSTGKLVVNPKALLNDKKIQIHFSIIFHSLIFYHDLENQNFFFV